MAPLNPYAAPGASAITITEDPAEVEARALRIAGGLLLLGAVLNVVSMALVNATAVRATYSAGWMSIAFDIWIGGSLLVGRFQVRGWALVRAALGALVFGVGSLLREDIAGGITVLVSCAAIVLLVAPKANRLRIILGTTMYGLVALLGIAGLALTP